MMTMDYMQCMNHVCIVYWHYNNKAKNSNRRDKEAHQYQKLTGFYLKNNLQQDLQLIVMPFLVPWSCFAKFRHTWKHRKHTSETHLSSRNTWWFFEFCVPIMLQSFLVFGFRKITSYLLFLILLYQKHENHELPILIIKVTRNRDPATETKFCEVQICKLICSMQFRLKTPCKQNIVAPTINKRRNSWCLCWWCRVDCWNLYQRQKCRWDRVLLPIDVRGAGQDEEFASWLDLVRR